MIKKRRFNRNNTVVSDVFYDDDIIQALVFVPDFSDDIPKKRDDEFLGSVCVYVHPADDRVEMSYLMENKTTGRVWLSYLPLTMEEACFLQMLVEEAIMGKGNREVALTRYPSNEEWNSL